MRGVELLARVQPAIDAPQPFAVGQPGAGQVQHDVRAFQTLDGLDEQVLGVLVGREKGPRTCHRAQSPVVSAGARPLCEPRQGRCGGFEVAEVRRGLDEFVQTPTVKSQILVLAALTGGREGLVVPTDTVEEDGSGEFAQPDQSALPPCGSVRRGRLDQVHCVLGDTPPRRQVQRVVSRRRMSRRRGDCGGLFDEPCRRDQFAPVDMDACPIDECRWNHRESTGFTRAPDHVGGDLLQDQVVPQFVRGRFLRNRERPHHGFAVALL